MIEVLVTMLVVGVVAGALLGLFVSFQRSERFVQDRGQALDDMRLAMEVMTKEIRQATAIDATSDADHLEIDTYVDGTTERVVYDASDATDELTRRVGTDPAVVLQGNLQSAAVFSYTYTDSVADAHVIAINLRVHPPRRPDTTLELESKVRLRNRG